jgi:hypothetical protein
MAMSFEVPKKCFDWAYSKRESFPFRKKGMTDVEANQTCVKLAGSGSSATIV